MNYEPVNLQNTNSDKITSKGNADFSQNLQTSGNPQPSGNLQAFHSFWSVPNYVRNNGRIGFPNFELLTAILSALNWQKFNGPIRMITDSNGKHFFESIGLGSLWGEIDPVLDRIDPGIDPFLFWAAGKLYALRSMETPCVMLDTDLIIWKEIRGLENRDIVAAHWEELNPAVYPPAEIFHFKDDSYHFPEDWDFRLCAANTAFLYMKNSDFRDYYVDQAIDFFRHVDMQGLNPVTAMCFAEQRTLPMCAKAKNQSLSYLLDLRGALDQDFVTHTWGFKSVLSSNPEANDEFCMRCVKRIAEDFPERTGLLMGCEALKGYYQRYLGTKNNSLIL